MFHGFVSQRGKSSSQYSQSFHLQSKMANKHTKLQCLTLFLILMTASAYIIQPERHGSAQKQRNTKNLDKFGHKIDRYVQEGLIAKPGHRAAKHFKYILEKRRIFYHRKIYHTPVLLKNKLDGEVELKNAENRAVSSTRYLKKSKVEVVARRRLCRKVCPPQLNGTKYQCKVICNVQKIKKHNFSSSNIPQRQLMIESDIQFQ